MRKCRAIVLLFAINLTLGCSGGTLDGKLASVSAYEEDLLHVLEQFPAYKEFKVHLEEHNVNDLPEYRRKSSRDLLNAIRESPYGFGKDTPAVVLRSRGRKAEDILIQDLAEGEGYYLACLVNILGEIPSAKRNSAFMNKLTQLVAPDDDFLRDNCVLPMIWALAVSGDSESIPIIQEFAHNESEWPEIRARSRVALNVLGSPQLMEQCHFSLRLDEGVSYQGGQAERPPFDILTDLLRHGLLTSSLTSPDKQTFLVEEVQREDPVTALRGVLPEELGDWEPGTGEKGGTKVREPGRWGLEIGEEDQGRVPVHYYWATGPLAGGYYLGVVEKRENKWLCIFWQHIVAI